ncbi:MAG TPA: SRPBCC family protein [Allosphingosinicella sp.]|nr:SRPBCC family protein [Allosphingosinicella sp.]
MTRFLLALLVLVLLIQSPAVAQDVAIGDRREADGTLTLSHEVVVAAPAADVWAAISTPEGWRTWAVPVSWVAADDPGSIESSYDAAARPGDPTIIRQHFLARLPGRLLVFRTTRAPQGFPHFETYARVTSFFELEVIDATRTRVRLTGAGYADDEAGRALLGFFRDGNRVSLERLRDRFVNGPRDWTAQR